MTRFGGQSDRLRRRTIDIPIPLIAVLGALAYGSAVFGWLSVPATEVRPAFGLGEAAYLGLSVVTPSDLYTATVLGELGITRDTPGWGALMFARVFGALFFLATVAKVAITWLYQAILKNFARWRNADHVVVIGKTDIADHVAEVAADRGLKVVQFEPGGKETVPDGILTLDSDIGLPEMLLWSAAHKARALVFATGDNADNADMAAQVFDDRDFQSKAIAASGRGAARLKVQEGPHIFVAADDAWFERRDELNYSFHQPPDTPMDGNELDSVVEFIGESRAAARAIMTVEPVFRLQQGEIQHILILGFGAMGEAILAEFCETQRTDPDRLPWITVFDPDPAVWESFKQRVPAWQDVFDGAFFGCTIDTLEERASAFAARLAAAPPAAIYVTTGAGLDSMAAAADAKRIIADMAESGDIPEQKIACPVFACARGGNSQVDGMAAGRIPKDRTGPVVSRLPIIQFGSWRDVVAASRVLDNEPDLAAFKVHATHNALYSDTPPTNWSNLAEVNRYSSRSAAGYVPALLHAAGFDLGPWLTGSDGQAPSVNRLPRLAPGDVLAGDCSTLVKLARLEHARWCAERYLCGFRRGPKDLARKRHHDLVPFDELGTSAKHYNIQYARLLQSMLLDEASGPVVTRPRDARRPVMRPTDEALVRDAGIDPASLAPPAPSSPIASQPEDPSPSVEDTELAHG
ncbi:MAG: hypothetical protein AAGJ32_04400 [Pseudomonadota bacterium]